MMLLTLPVIASPRVHNGSAMDPRGLVDLQLQEELICDTQVRPIFQGFVCCISVEDSLLRTDNFSQIWADVLLIFELELNSGSRAAMFSSAFRVCDAMSGPNKPGSRNGVKKVCIIFGPGM